MASVGADAIPGIPGDWLLIKFFISIYIGSGGGVLLEAVFQVLPIPLMGKITSLSRCP